eukprot:SAG31_NODE_43788_length_265_cov_1.054217_2_plen_29_part_01
MSDGFQSGGRSRTLRWQQWAKERVSCDED